MKAFVRVLVVFTLLAALLPAQGGLAQTPSADPKCEAVAMMLGARAEVGKLGEAIYCILYPPDIVWNRDVVMFAHGYMNILEPISIPWDTQLVIDDQTSLPGLILNLGYAFAVTSYSKNGLAVQEGVQDIVNLAKFIRTTNDQVEKIYLTGASEGGLVTALAIERYHQFFAGGLSTCGPIGSFPYQIQYWGDFRVAFDQAYPMNSLTLNTTPIFVPQALLPSWNLIQMEIAQLLLNDINAARVLLESAGVPYDPADLQTVVESVLGLLYYNVFATNDGRMTLVPGLTEGDLLPPSIKGNPYINPDLGFLPDPAALAAMEAYETTGKLNRPLVVMHTTGDPIIPFAHSLMYLQKAPKAAKLGRLSVIPIERYGHCAFQPAEMVFAFNLMVTRTTFLPFSSGQIQSALPNEKDQNKFHELMKKNKDLQD